MRFRQLDNSMSTTLGAHQEAISLSSVGPYTALVIRARWHQGDLSLVRVPWNSFDPISTASASAVEIGRDCLSPPSSYTKGQFSLFSSTLYHGDFLGSGRPTSASARHQPRIPRSSITVSQLSIFAAAGIIAGPLEWTLRNRCSRRFEAPLPRISF